MILSAQLTIDFAVAAQESIAAPTQAAPRDKRPCPTCKTEQRMTVHPTVKSTALMAWLCRLVTPPGGLILDPFLGSGSTGVAALREGFRFAGIERETEYMAIAKRRLDAEDPSL